MESPLEKFAKKTGRHCLEAVTVKTAICFLCDFVGLFVEPKEKWNVEDERVFKIMMEIKKCKRFHPPYSQTLEIYFKLNTILSSSPESKYQF